MLSCRRFDGNVRVPPHFAPACQVLLLYVLSYGCALQYVIFITRMEEKALDELDSTENDHRIAALVNSLTPRVRELIAHVYDVP